MNIRILFMLVPLCCFAQTKYVALSSNNTFNNFGTIFEIDDDVPHNTYIFTDNGAPPHDNLLDIGGKLYGVTAYNGALGRGSLFEYDYLTETYTTLRHFDAIGTTDTQYLTELCTDGTYIYGVQTNFFTGVSIVQYDIANDTMTSLASLSGIGVNEVSDLVYSSNGTLYGVSTPTSGVDNILFSVDIATGTLTAEHTFTPSTGHWCYSLIAHSNGNIYGTPIYGGSNDMGTLFEFDTTADTYNVLYNFTSTYRADNLIEVDANNLWGYVNPVTGGGARFYKYELSSNTMTNEFFFPSTLQVVADGDPHRDFKPLFHSNGVLYGVSKLQSVTDRLFFRYDTVNGTFSSELNNHITTSFTETSDGRIVYGTTEQFANGTLVEYEPSDGSTTTFLHTEFGTEGKVPSKIIRASNGLIYGVTYPHVNQIYGDVLFSYNIETDEYHKLIDFADYPHYGNDPTNLIETSDGRIYIYSRFGAPGTEQGTLVEYDPSNGSHALRHEWSDLSDGQTIGENVDLFEDNNVIYGVKRWGGNDVLYRGTIFSYDTVNHTYSVRYETDDLVDMTSSIIVTSQGIMYGTTNSGGVHGEGYIFSFDFNTNTYTNMADLTMGGFSQFVELDNGDVYGVIENSLGTDGSVIKIDGTSGLLSVHYAFDHAIEGTGNNPYRLFTTYDKLYIQAQAPPVVNPTFFRRLIVELDPVTLTTNIIYDEEGIGGSPLNDIMYVMDDGRLLGTSARLFSYELGDSEVQPVFSFDPSTIKNAFSIVDMTNVPSLSVGEGEKHVSVNVYPNPTRDYLIIHGIEDIPEVQVFDMLGRHTQIHIKDSRIDVRNLSSGLYMLRFKDTYGKTHTMKFLKE